MSLIEMSDDGVTAMQIGKRKDHGNEILASGYKDNPNLKIKIKILKGLVCLTIVTGVTY